MATKKKNPDICYTYSTTSKGVKTFRYSVRAGNDHSNSLGSNKFQTAGGRNKAVARMKKKDKSMKVVQGRP